MTIKSVKKSFQILTFLNSRPGSRAHDVTVACGFPRSTVTRALKSLCEMGYASQDASATRYFVTDKVLELSAGFGPEEIFRHKVTRLLEDLASDLKWPIVISRPRDSFMEVFFTNCRSNPFAIARPKYGDRFAMLESASGLAFLSVADRNLQSALIAKSHISVSDSSRQNLAYQLDTVRRQGYAIRQKLGERETVIATPLISSARAYGALGMRFIKSAVPERSVTASLLPIMTELSARISQLFEPGRTQQPDPVM
jgi:IclR family transcriptional regulator, mhp operon transcriptional activator